MQTMTDQLQTTISQTLENASPEALETLFDAGVFEEHLALVLEGVDDSLLEQEINAILAACNAIPQDEGSYVFPCLESLRFLMAEITRLLEAGEEPETAQAIEDEFIVFTPSSLTAPSTLPDTDGEQLELESTGFQLRKIPFSSIQVVPANNPRSRTARAGIVRLARNISKRGLQQPVTVRPNLEQPELVQLVFGYRRMAAIGYAIAQGWLPEDHDVQCIVRKLNDSQVRLAALTENEEREEVDMLDQAEGWARLRLTQTESAIANAAGLPLTAIKRCLKVAFGVCEEAKSSYRQNTLSWSSLVAFTYGSLAMQRSYLESVGNSTWKLAPEYVKQAMTVSDFKLANARFTLEEYEAAGGQLETDLWSSAEGTRLLSSKVIEQLQSAWANNHARELQAQGFVFVEIRSGDWVWWSEFNRVPRGTEGTGAIIHIRPDWAVDVIEHVIPVQANSSAGTSSSSSNNANGSSTATSQPEEPKLEFTEAGITLARRTRTAALQQAILENSDAKLPLALAVLGFLGEQEIRFKITHLGEVDAITSKVILSELETYAMQIPNLSFSPSSGLELNSMVRHQPEKRLETFQALLNLAKTDLEHLHRLLIATLIGDFATATDGQLEQRRRKLKVDSLIAALAAHLGVKGGEALEVSEEYLKTIGFRKAKLRPYLIAAFGEQLANALLENPRAKIIAEFLNQKTKLPKDFTPPELSFEGNSGDVVKLEVSIDDFDDENVTLEEDPDLISEEDLSFLEHLEPEQMASAD
jgi:ParB/RepB/Spo0J family partition protein